MYVLFLLGVVLVVEVLADGGGNGGIPAALMSDAKSCRGSVVGVGGCCTGFGYKCIGAYMGAVCMYCISSLPVVNVSVGGKVIFEMIENLFMGSGSLVDLVRVVIIDFSVL